MLFRPDNVDISEDDILRLSPKLLDALLVDRSSSTSRLTRHIIWATSDYEQLGPLYDFHSQIEPKQITGERNGVIVPRSVKNAQAQRARARGMAEVFTPAWVCNLQNNLIDAQWFGRKDVFNHENADRTWTTVPWKIQFPPGKTWQDYVLDRRLEVSCGEAPYLVSRYDSASGQPIPLAERVGLLDRKLRVVGENAKTPTEWRKWAREAYKSLYAFEWQGDNLLLARENMLVSFADYHTALLGKDPTVRTLLEIAQIISWNLWQMDGLKGVVPATCHDKISDPDMFGNTESCPCPGCQTGDFSKHTGTQCKVRDWQAAPPDNIKTFSELLS